MQESQAKNVCAPNGSRTTNYLVIPVSYEARRNSDRPDSATASSDAAIRDRGRPDSATARSDAVIEHRGRPDSATARSDAAIRDRGRPDSATARSDAAIRDRGRHVLRPKIRIYDKSKTYNPRSTGYVRR